MRTLSLILMLSCAGLANAQCAGGNCTFAPSFAPVMQPTYRPFLQPVQSEYTWSTYTHLPGTLYLYHGNKQLGGYDIATGVYKPLLDYQKNIWGSASTPPHPLPTNYYLKAPVAVPNYGVDMSKLSRESREHDSYKLNGLPIPKDAAYDAVEKGIADDSAKMRLTIIGSDEDRARVEKDLAAPEQADLMAAVNVWSVRPDHHSLYDSVTKQPGYVTTGKPTIYLQAPDGKVLHRQDDYRPGDIAAIRKAGNYDHKRDPDVRRPSSAGLGLPLPLILGLGVFAGCVYMMRRNHAVS